MVIPRPFQDPLPASTAARPRRVFTTALLLATALLFATAVAAPTASADDETPAPVIDQVEIRLDAPPARPVDVESLLAIAPGDRLEESAVRRSLSNLYATGLFSEIEILERREEDELVVVVALFSQTWVDAVEIAGQTALGRQSLLGEINQKVGEPLHEDRLLESVQALIDLLQRSGYREAEVRLDVVPRAVGKRVGVVFHVAEGPRAQIGTILFAGDLGSFPPADLLKALQAGPGTPYERQRVAGDGERLRHALAAAGWLQARVTGPREDYDAASGRVDLTYEIDAGPPVRVVVHGAEIEKLRKKGLLPFLEDQVYDRALLTRTQVQLVTHFQRQGHYRVQVSAEERETADGALEVLIEVEPGPVFELVEIEFIGNQRFDAATLASLMSTTERRALKPQSGRLVRETLDEDLGNLRSFYALEGFSRAEIGPTRVVELGGGKLRLEIPIVEGPRRRVVHLRLPGAAHLDAAAVRSRLPLRRGGPYHPVLLDDTVNALRALYEEEGYPEALVTPHLDWNDGGTLVDVDLRIEEGRRAVVDRVILRGHHRTRSEVLRRFSGLRSGDVISRRKLLETERELYQLGIFSRVDVELGPRVEPDGARDVLIHLEEGRPWRLTYGLSYHSDDGLGALVGLSRVNIGGRGDRLQLDLRANERDRRFRLIFDQPALGKLDLPITYTLFRQEEERESFTVEDTGFQVSLTKDFLARKGRRARLGLTYDYRLVDLLETVLDPDEIERQDRDLQISSLTPNLFLDRRDDALDPSRGFTTTLQLEYAFPFVGATANFAKLFWQGTHYLPLGEFGVLASSARWGAIEPLDNDAPIDPLVPEGLASRLVPVSERFFAGGRTTHRAYERDQLGIPGETLLDFEGQTFEAGGNGLLLFNFDYRFPIAGQFGGTVFFDLGNVWADWREVDFDRMKPGMGVGVRYASPIGPVRLEIGWKLDPEPSEDNDPVFFLSLGNPF